LIARENPYLKYHSLPLQTPLLSCNLLGPIPNIRQKKYGSVKLKGYITVPITILHFPKLILLICRRVPKLGITNDNEEDSTSTVGSQRSG